MRIEKNTTPIDKQAEEEYAASIAASNKSIMDYNIMMGVLEDPGEEEDENE